MIPITALCGSPYRPRVTVTISSNTANYTLSTSLVSGYVAGVTDVTLVINSNVWVYSLDPTLPALTIDSSFAVGDTVLIQNNGLIFGGGGDGAGSRYIGGGGNGAAQYANNGATTVNTNGGAGAYGNPDVGAPITATGGGGGIKQFGSQVTGTFLSVTTTGVTNGAGGAAGQGGGGGGIIIYNEFSGNSYGNGGGGGASNGPGQNGNPINFTGGPSGYVACAGGGGGYGGAGGVGAFFSFNTSLSLLAAGAAGKAIELNGNAINILSNNTIWGAVS